VEDEFDIEVPREHEAGVHADSISAWFTRRQVVLDFGATGPAGSGNTVQSNTQTTLTSTSTTYAPSTSGAAPSVTWRWRVTCGGGQEVRTPAALLRSRNEER
jgi:hypothetical protein